MADDSCPSAGSVVEHEPRDEPDVGDFEVLLPTVQGLLQTDLQIELSLAFHRKETAATAELIEAEWNARLARNPALFNGTKFRLESVSKETAGDPVILRLGLTDYKSFLGTNCSSRWPALLAESEANLASPLGNAAVVETSDKHVVLLRRSGTVGEIPDVFVMPGGHPEPEMAGIKDMSFWKSLSDADRAALSQAVSRELWDGVRREVVEETGVSDSDLSEAICLGFTRRVLNHRPDMIFLMSCRLQSDEVKRLYLESTGVDRQESTALITLPREDFIREVLDHGTITLPGCQRGGVALYKQYLASQLQNGGNG